MKYKVTEIDRATLEKSLNILGLQGWRVVHLHYMSSSVEVTLEKKS